MIPNQQIEARLMAGLVALALAFTAGCSSSRSKDREATASAPQAEAAAQPAAETMPAEDITATEAAVSAEPSAASQSDAEGGAGDGSPVVNPDAPKRYTVKRGDTLWDISTMFLRDPWLWPEVWYVNPQVENPHLIYPGDVLALGYGANGSPQIRLERGGAARLNPRLRSSPLD